MEENPYKAPLESGYHGDDEVPQRFHLLGMSVIEWMVVIGLVLVLTALLLPEPKHAPRRRPLPPNTPSTVAP